MADSAVLKEARKILSHLQFYPLNPDWGYTYLKLFLGLKDTVNVSFYSFCRLLLALFFIKTIWTVDTFQNSLRLAVTISFKRKKKKKENASL